MSETELISSLVQKYRDISSKIFSAWIAHELTKIQKYPIKEGAIICLAKRIEEYRSMPSDEMIDRIYKDMNA
jgi:hypothetical protein